MLTQVPLPALHRAVAPPSGRRPSPCPTESTRWPDGSPRRRRSSERHTPPCPSSCRATKSAPAASRYRTRDSGRTRCGPRSTRSTVLPSTFGYRCPIRSSARRASRRHRPERPLPGPPRPSIPGSPSRPAREDGRLIAELRRDLDERLVDQNRNRIEVGCVGFKAQALASNGMVPPPANGSSIAGGLPPVDLRISVVRFGKHFSSERSPRSTSRSMMP